MHHIRNILLVIGTLIAVTAVIIFLRGQFKKTSTLQPITKNFQIVSGSFLSGTKIPDRNTCNAENLSPPLQIANIPKNTKSLALIMHDQNAPGGDFTHWLVWNINPTDAVFNEGAVPSGAQQGTTDFGTHGYGGPCPDSGVHNYIFDVYALDTELNLLPTARRADVDKAMATHVLARTSMGGKVVAQDKQAAQ